jgi:MATE family multidrug resistance protein
MTLNRYPEGSVRQLWIIALPLIMSSLSGMAMLFVDRLVLAHFTLEAHNAAVEATNLGWAFLTGWSSLASVTQIFVAQNNGAGQRHLLGHPVWQMIWLGLLSVLVFCPLALWGPTLFFGEDESFEMQRSYFFWMLLFGPSHGLFAALCGFFIGQGKTIITSSAVIAGNIINSILCYLFIFGWEGIFSALGVTGAAIATDMAVVAQVLILSCAFFKRSNRENFGTSEWKWNPALLKKCMRVGLPSAFFSLLEVAGWAIFYKMMVVLGKNHLTVAGIVQNILILFNFFGDGLSRAVATISGNALGAKHPGILFKLVRSGFILMTGFALCFALLLWLTHQFIIDWFLDSASASEQALLFSSLIFGLGNAVIYKYLEGIRLVISGALNAAADTLFLLICGSCSIWLFMVIPIYLFVFRQAGSIEMALGLCSLYTLLAASLYAWRFYSKAWQKNASLVSNDSIPFF